MQPVALDLVILEQLEILLRSQLLIHVYHDIRFFIGFVDAEEQPIVRNNNHINKTHN